MNFIDILLITISFLSANSLNIHKQLTRNEPLIQTRSFTNLPDEWIEELAKTNDEIKRNRMKIEKLLIQNDVLGKQLKARLATVFPIETSDMIKEVEKSMHYNEASYPSDQSTHVFDLRNDNYKYKTTKSIKKLATSTTTKAITKSHIKIDTNGFELESTNDSFKNSYSSDRDDLFSRAKSGTIFDKFFANRNLDSLSRINSNDEMETNRYLNKRDNEVEEREINEDLSREFINDRRKREKLTEVDEMNYQDNNNYEEKLTEDEMENAVYDEQTENPEADHKENEVKIEFYNENDEESVEKEDDEE